MTLHTDERTRKIRERLHSDFGYLQSLGHTVLGVFLQGSQNYNLDYEGSDIDTKAIIIPKFKDVVLNKKPVSTTLILPSNEHIDVKDIRLYVDCFYKQNINFIEILFTPYKIVDPNYAPIFQPMFDNNERIAHYNNYKAVNAIAGTAYEKRKALCHPYPTLAEKIEKYGYDNKQLHHILRCEEFLERYIKGVPYAKCLIPACPEYLIKVKARYIYTVDEAIEIADRCVKSISDIKQKYFAEHEVNIDHEVEDIMNDVIYNTLRQAFVKEIHHEKTYIY